MFFASPSSASSSSHTPHWLLYCCEKSTNEVVYWRPTLLRETESVMVCRWFQNCNFPFDTWEDQTTIGALTVYTYSKSSVFNSREKRGLLVGAVVRKLIYNVIYIGAVGCQSNTRNVGTHRSRFLFSPYIACSLKYPQGVLLPGRLAARRRLSVLIHTDHIL